MTRPAVYWRQHEAWVRTGLLEAGRLEEAIAALRSALVLARGSRGARLRLVLRSVLAAPTLPLRRLRALTDAPTLFAALRDREGPDRSWILGGPWSAQDSPRWLRAEGQDLRDAAATIDVVDRIPREVGAVVADAGGRPDVLRAALDAVRPGGWCLLRGGAPGAAPEAPGPDWREDRAATEALRAVDRTVLYGPAAIYRRTRAVDRAR